MYTHTQIPELKFFVIQLGVKAPSVGHLDPALGVLCAKFSNFFTTEKRINLTVVAENVCPVVTRLFEKKKSSVMKSEGRTNIADKDKKKNKKIVLKNNNIIWKLLL